MNKIFKKNNSGHVVILNTLFFLAISLAIIFGVAGPVTNSYSASKSLLKSKESFILANSAGEEALYRMKTGMDLSSAESLQLAGGIATINIGDQSDEKIVTIHSEIDEYQRDLLVAVEKSVGVTFNYGLQSGKGGFIMTGGAGINGNVYSNGNIIGSGGAYITGSATVANQSSPESVISNLGAEIPTYSFDFGGNGIDQDAAQSFQVATTTPLTSIKFYIKKSSNNWMNNISVKITTDNSGAPSKTTVADGIISAQQVTTSFNYISVPFTSTPELTPGETYWVVLDTGTTWGSYYSIGATGDDYINGELLLGTHTNKSDEWSQVSPVGADTYFEVFVGGETGIITGIKVGESGGDAWAHEVNDSTIFGDLYCQAGTGNHDASWNGVACDTSRVDPVQQPYPVSDGNIEEWKSIAENGEVHEGNLELAGDDYYYFGPGKINGNLSLGNGAILEISGTTWVTGDIFVTGQGVIKLGVPYGPNEGGIVVNDGQISLTAGGQMQGTGESGSYILAVTTNQCPEIGDCGNNEPAVLVTGGTGSVILNAQNGTVEFQGGASAKQVTADTVIMSGGTIVDYETGIVNVNFSSGPSGSWSIISWDEVVSQ